MTAAVLHADHDGAFSGPAVLPMVRHQGKSAVRSDVKAEASTVFSDCLAFARLSREGAAEVLGCSRKLVDFKCDVDRPEQASLADLMSLADGGGRAVEAVALIVGVLGRRLDGARAVVPARLLPQLALGLGSMVGELFDAVVAGVVGEELRVVILKRIAAVRRQLDAIETCVRAA